MLMMIGVNIGADTLSERTVGSTLADSAYARWYWAVYGHLVQTIVIAYDQSW